MRWDGTEWLWRQESLGLVVSVGLEVFVLERRKRHKHTLKMWKSARREREGERKRKREVGWGLGNTCQVSNCGLDSFKS